MPTAVLTIDLFGAPRVRRAERLLDMPVRKELALLAYLAVAPAHPYRRDHLLGLLWPEVPDAAARNNLRVVLAGLRQKLGDAAAVLHIDRQQVRFVPTDDHHVDVLTFRALLAAVRVHPHTAVETCAACVTRLTEAVTLYQGDFLAGFSLPDSAPFEEWATIQREQLHHQQLDALHTLARAAEHRGDYTSQGTYARRQLALEPWRESAHAQLMRSLWASGQRGAALEQYELCRRILADELGLEPSPELAVLADELRGAIAPRTGTLPPSVLHPQRVQDGAAPQPSWPDIPEVVRLYGRDDDLARVEHWLIHDGCRLVAILGIGGVGKTTLAAAAASAVAGHFTVVVWRSLQNAPPLDELLRDVIQQLTPGGAELPSALDAQIGLLLDTLRYARVLLVLDNLESILRPDEPGAMRLGYAGYAQLLLTVAQRPHRSCILITSRERPTGIGRLADDSPLVQLFPLAGLGGDAAAQMLATRGVTVEGADADALTERYSGNPLALRLIAQTVREVFDGDMRAFLAIEAPIFDDIGTVLAQQIARLSGLERELLFWLAIAREPVDALALRANLVSPGPSRATLEAVRALLRRSLVAQSGSGLALQNVVTEYVTETLIAHVVGELVDDQPPGAPPADDPHATLNRFALCQTQAKDYVRASQVRLILEPVAARARERLGRVALIERLHTIVARIRVRGERVPGYAAGNVLNLLRYLDADLRGADFARLCVWQADLRGVPNARLNFSHADLSHSAFTAMFDVAAVQFTTDGQLLVAGVISGELCLWRAANGQLHDRFRRSGSASTPVVFSPAGQTIANCGLDGSVRVWSTTTGAQVCVFPGHTDIPYTLAFSTDGQRLASGSLDGVTRVWDVTSGQLHHIFYQQASMINGLAFSSDGTLLAGAGSDQRIYLWDMDNGQVVGTLVGHTREIESLVFSGDGHRLISGAHDGSMRVWDVASGQSVWTIAGHSQIVRTLALHPDGHTIASGSVDRTVKLWDIRDGQLLRTLLDHTHEISALAFSADGQMVASGSVDRTVRVWETRTGYALASLRGYGEIVRSVAFSPDGTLLASSGANGIISVWRVHALSEGVRADQRAQELRSHPHEIRSVVFSPDGRFLASGGSDQIVSLWDVTSGTVVRMLRGHTNTIKTLAWSPDGSILASGGADQTIRLWSLAADHPSPTERVLRGHTDEISSLVFSADGRTLLSSSLDHSARVWAIDTGQVIHMLMGASSALSSALFRPDMQQIVATRYDYTMHRWQVHNGQPPALVSDDGVEALLIAFSPDGTLLACVARHETIELRSVASETVRHTLHGHHGEIVALAFSPTAPRLVSSDSNGMIRMWDVTTGACLHSFRAEGPYAGMDITEATGLSDGQRAALHALGAVERAEGRR